jgi:hypothetical protein
MMRAQNHRGRDVVCGCARLRVCTESAAIGKASSGFEFVESFAFGVAEPERVPSEAEGTHPVVACRAKPDTLLDARLDCPRTRAESSPQTPIALRRGETS